MKTSRLWTATFVFLLLALVTGGIALYWRYPRTPSLEIVLPSPTPLPSHVYIDGAVTSPGWYPLYPGEGLEELLKMAAPNTEADLEQVKVYIPLEGASSGSQRVDINRAEPWLLEVLPGIGPRLAEAIVRYRQEKGPFHSPHEIQLVPGIGVETYEKIKDLITVGE